MWIVDRIKTKPGTRAGTVSKNRYRHIKIDYKCYQEHQLAFEAYKLKALELRGEFARI